MAAPSDLPTHHDRAIELDVAGALPPCVSGRIVAIAVDGSVHLVDLSSDHVAYRSARAPSPPMRSVVAFGEAVLALGGDSRVYELSARLETMRLVDLAGHRRPVATPPTVDASTGEMHLVALGVDGVPCHVVIPDGGLTRRVHPLGDVAAPIREISVTRDHVVLLAPDSVGIAARNGEPHTAWIDSGGHAATPLHAFERAGAVVVHVLTPLLERWTLDPRAGTIRRKLVDPRPGRCAGGAVFVADPGSADADGGWILGFDRDPATGATELTVTGLADTRSGRGPAVATVRMPPRFPYRTRCGWLPSPAH